jgi:hypothetical protein
MTAFGHYLADFANSYVTYYAGLASAMIALVYLYYSAWIFVFGGELNAVIAHFREEAKQIRLAKIKVLPRPLILPENSEELTGIDFILAHNMVEIGITPTQPSPHWPDLPLRGFQCRRNEQPENNPLRGDHRRVAFQRTRSQY